MSDAILTSEPTTDNQPARLHVEFYGYGQCFTLPCVVCGGQSTSDPSARFRGTDERTAILSQWEICPECLAAGAKGAADRARQHAAWLREHADELETSAREIEAIQDWPTEADREAYIDTAQAEIMDYEEQRRTKP